MQPTCLAHPASLLPTEQRLHFEVFLEAEYPELAAVAGLFVAAEGQAAVEGGVVEVDAARADALAGC